MSVAVRKRGQAMVEFALVLPFLLALLFVTSSAAEVILTDMRVSRIAHEGARIGAEQTDYSAATSVATSRMQEIAQGYGLGTLPTNDLSFSQSNAFGGYGWNQSDFVVTVTYQYVTPIPMAYFSGNGIALRDLTFQLNQTSIAKVSTYRNEL